LTSDVDAVIRRLHQASSFQESTAEAIQLFEGMICSLEMFERSSFQSHSKHCIVLTAAECLLDGPVLYNLYEKFDRFTRMDLVEYLQKNLISLSVITPTSLMSLNALMKDLVRPHESSA
jgi:hypothetical protein